MALATGFATIFRRRSPRRVDAMIPDAVSTSTGDAWRKALLMCGIASSLLYGAMIGAIRFEGYSRSKPLKTATRDAMDAVKIAQLTAACGLACVGERD